jgi:hypothetical protein
LVKNVKFILKIHTIYYRETMIRQLGPNFLCIVAVFIQDVGSVYKRIRKYLNIYVAIYHLFIYLDVSLK